MVVIKIITSIFQNAIPAQIVQITLHVEMIKSVPSHYVQKAVQAMHIVKQATTLAFAHACQGTWEILILMDAKVSSIYGVKET